ncbi:AraC family transcriptional regulator [Congregibacter brevis]|uniref:AraC family transcriptional regulator n=1 Tax=Congregibacter brevis TaxID=3081201 RepID=A0ABZ0IDI7_9GAMM|nr:AraC family transcriptional regulator [Congregibacter sp. IMCC45268]
MSRPSNWPLSPSASRVVTPKFLLDALQSHPLTCGCYPTAMGYYPGAHGHFMHRERHDDNLLLLCTEGCGTVKTQAEQFSVSSGDTVVLPRALKHSYAADTDTPWTLYWVHFQGTDADEFVKHLLIEGDYRIHSGVEPSLLTGFEQMLTVGSTGYSLDAFIGAANRLRHLLAEFALCRDRQRSQNMGRMHLTELQSFMRERVSSSLSLKELASFTGLTPQHFATRYKAETGYSPMRHFLHMKMEAACRLLDSTQHSVKVIAAKLGYLDPLYFSRMFRQTVGLSPSQYRESQRG